MSIAEQKQELRQQLLSRREAFSEKDYQYKSQKIINKLKIQPEFREAEIIHCYVSLNKRNEVNTLPLIKHLLTAKKRVVVPVTNFDDGTLSHTFLNEFSALQENKWGVLEPAKGKTAEPDEMDLVIVPMAGGDYKKNRIGYGKGFYDRFLNKVSCSTIGLLFDDCLVSEIPVEEFDVPLSKIITEEHVIE
ncbi:MAG: 5-formyltetrahydrofolate cyclo-ligase [Balneolaceae bacterium]|nr:5-formyltetrahydrofolate cyclo-ligase [Balneolaceae bacterium]